MKHPFRAPAPAGMRPFLLLWSTQSLSALGSSMTSFALIVWSYQQQGSALTTSLLSVCSYAPYVAMSLFAGALCDRLDKKRTMLVCDTLAAVTTLCVYGLLRAGRLAVWHLYLLSALNGLMNTVQQPASDVTVTLLAPRDKLQRVSGLQSFSNALVTVLTPAAASAVLAFGGLDVVMRAIPTKTLLMPKSAPGKTPTTKTYLDMLQAADETGVELVYAAPGQQFSFDEGKIEVLGPTEQYEDANNTSVVLRFTYGQTRFLFTGDAEKKSEKALLGAGTDLRADVLKLGHHGSDTSTSTDFLQAVSPAYAVACVGADNSYGHPSQQTLDLLGSRGVALYRTDLQGNLLFNTDGQHITVQTQK